MAAPFECPSCGEYDRCYKPGCICPMCCPPKAIWSEAEDALDRVITKWIQLTPVMLELNKREASWGWDASGFVAEITLPGQDDGNDFSVMAGVDHFAVVHEARIRRATQEHPEEWDEVDSFSALTPESAVDWMEGRA